MDTRTLQITRPCPVQLDVDRSARQFFCDHCQKDVHVLANWPRAEAEAFIAANRGKSMCISLLRDVDGELLYADSPARVRPAPLVPLARLRRSWLPEAAAAAGVAAVLTACAPHQPIKGVGDPEEEVGAHPIPGLVVPDEIGDGARAIADETTPCDPVVREPRVERGEKPARFIERPAGKKTPKPTAPDRREMQPLDGGIDL